MKEEAEGKRAEGFEEAMRGAMRPEEVGAIENEDSPA